MDECDWTSGRVDEWTSGRVDKWTIPPVLEVQLEVRRRGEVLQDELIGRLAVARRKGTPRWEKITFVSRLCFVFFVFALGNFHRELCLFVCFFVF